MAAFSLPPHMVGQGGVGFLLSLLTGTLIPSQLLLHSGPHLNLITSKGHISKYITLGVKALIYEFWGDMIQSIAPS